MKHLVLLLTLAVGSLLMGSCFWPYDDYYYDPPRHHRVVRHHVPAPRHHAPAPIRHHHPRR